MSRKDVLEGARSEFKSMGYRKITIEETYPEGPIIALVAVPDGTEFKIYETGAIVMTYNCLYCGDENGVEIFDRGSIDMADQLSYCRSRKGKDCEHNHRVKLERDSQGCLSRLYGRADDWCRRNFGVGIVK